MATDTCSNITDNQDLIQIQSEFALFICKGFYV